MSSSMPGKIITFYSYNSWFGPNQGGLKDYRSIGPN